MNAPVVLINRPPRSYKGGRKIKWQQFSPKACAPHAVAYLVWVFGATELPNTGAVTNIGRLIASIRQKTRAFRLHMKEQTNWASYWLASTDLVTTGHE
ncbi:hypothetical protein CEXT_422131 [Caerostris extrusa]|uniref:Ubiquitinyl hydrolase 1 n=1 Tax=Caerostris extrusa TaxID=172846 RepID=A0AAV4QDG0_CAEEX|nr:hypothetical protein CEXT_422131 [Caerostris extrusa]